MVDTICTAALSSTRSRRPDINKPALLFSQEEIRWKLASSSRCPDSATRVVRPTVCGNFDRAATGTETGHPINGGVDKTVTIEKAPLNGPPPSPPMSIHGPQNLQ